MRTVRAFVGAIAIAVLASGLAQAQDKVKDKPPVKDKAPAKDKDKTAPTTGVKLPTHYPKLGLTAEQKTKILAIRAEAQDKVTALDKQKADILAKAKADYEAVLTADQKKALRDLLLKAAPK